MADVLGIYSWDDTRGRTWFRARGTGVTYQRLYEWLRTVKIAEQWDDMPWHGFTFEDPQDGKALVALFEDHYIGHEDEVEEVDDDPEPSGPQDRSVIESVYQDLHAALTAEIDREILAQIGIASR